MESKKVYIVFTGYWMYEAVADIVFSKKKDAEKYKEDYLSKHDNNYRAYIQEYIIH